MIMLLNILWLNMINSWYNYEFLENNGERVKLYVRNKCMYRYCKDYEFLLNLLVLKRKGKFLVFLLKLSCI